MIRKPVVSGAFYPRNPDVLSADLEKLIDFEQNKQRALGLISPHAGYVYSGECAGKGFSRVEIPDTVIILGVNHHGVGHAFAVDGYDHWNTPLGDIAIHHKMRERLLSTSSLFQLDNLASSKEHSLEVQVPFIQMLNPNAQILPITLSSLSLSALQQGGLEIAGLIKEFPETLIVASTDMSHYISVHDAEIKDQLAIQQILKLNFGGLLQIVKQERISMCGVAPTVMLLAAATALGAKRAEVVEYTHSGVVSGDLGSVVAYLSMIIPEK